MSNYWKGTTPRLSFVCGRRTVIANTTQAYFCASAGMAGYGEGFGKDIPGHHRFALLVE